MMLSLARRALPIAISIATLCSCQLLKKKADADGADASAPTGSAGAVAPSEPALPTTFELVAVGKRSGSKIVWLKKVGDRVWLSGMGLDAFADGDAELGPGSDLTQGLAQKPQEGWEYAGNGSSLFALRYQADTYKSDDPTMIWARDGKGAWSSGAKVRHYEVHEWLRGFGFTPWKDGVLYMYGQAGLSNTGDLTNPALPGTSFQFVSPKGDIKDATFDVPKDVMAWSADSDGATLSLIGNRVVKGKSLGTVLLRGNEKALAETVLVESPATTEQSIIVREHGTAALAYQKVDTADGNTTVYLVKDQAKEARKIQIVPAGSGGIVAAAYVGGTVYAAVVHKEHHTLARAAESGEPTTVKLPSLAKGTTGFHAVKDGEAGLTCEPTDVFARKNDLWVTASCAGQGMKVPAVFRLGHPQEPVQLP